MLLVGQQPKIGYDLHAREELVRTYVEKEHDLSERLEKDKSMIKHLRMENRALKQYSKGLKYLAEDWAPLGVLLPDILTRPSPVRLDDEGTPLAQRALVQLVPAADSLIDFNYRKKKLRSSVPGTEDLKTK